MAGEKIMSGQLRLRIDDKTVYHATGVQLSYTRSTKERITKDTNGREESKGIMSFSVSGDALGVYDSDGATALDFKALFVIMNDDTDVKIPVEFLPDEADATFKLTGDGVMKSLNLNANVDEDATCSFTIDGGRLAIVELPVI
jgi:hypothetical protein